MDRIRTTVFSTICCLALAGCVKPMDCTTMDKLSVGTSTVQSAVALFGQPTASTPGTDGTTLVRWESTTHSNVGGGTFTTLLLTFGKDGKLVSKSCNTVENKALVQEPAGG
jgi:hypothetical protein